MVVQIVPAAPSVPWTDPRSAGAWQRPVADWPPWEPLVDGGVVVGAGDWGGAVPDGWVAGAWRAALEWAAQPVTATAASMMVAMSLAGRMAAPPKLHDPGWVQRHQRRYGRSRPDHGRAS
jgi:hypothetical protein